MSEVHGERWGGVGGAGDNGSCASSVRETGRTNEQVGSISGLWIPAKGSQPGQ